MLPKTLLKQLTQRPPLAILSGAGLSAESGIPTFRQAQTGLWAQFSPQDLATPEAFFNNPKRVWDWYRWRRELVQQGQPNAGHLCISDLQAELDVCNIVTQNVDRLQQRAGARQVTELHGNIWRQRCSAECGFIESVDVPGDDDLPRCPVCEALLRPDVVWFGETLPAQAMYQATRATEAADVVFVIGTSNLVYPAASLPLEALRAGKTLVEINMQPTPLSASSDYFIQACASQVLPELTKYLLKHD